MKCFAPAYGLTGEIGRVAALQRSLWQSIDKRGSGYFSALRRPQSRLGNWELDFGQIALHKS